MDFKHFSWLFAIIGLFTHIFGLLRCIVLIAYLTFFILGCLCAIYIQRGDLNNFLTDSKIKNPLESHQQQKRLGLNLVCDQKPIVLISPNIRIQTDRETKKKQKSQQRHHHHHHPQLNQYDVLTNNSSSPNKNIATMNYGNKKSQQQATSSSSSISIFPSSSSSSSLSPYTSTSTSPSSALLSSSSSTSLINMETVSDVKKRSIIDTGIELFFKKHGKNIRDGQHIKLLHHDVCLDTTTTNTMNNRNLIMNNGNTNSIRNQRLHQQQESKQQQQQKHHHIVEEKTKWKPFENIKIYTEKKKLQSSLSTANSNPNKNDKHHETEQIQFGEDCTIGDRQHGNIHGPNIDYYPYKYVTLSSDAHLLDEHGSPKKKQRTMLSGNKQIDQLLHTIIDYILRDFIDSWFCSLSDNKEFSEFRVRNCIEECVMNICQRTKNTEWIPLMTTKIIDNLATHTRLYRHANQSINCQKTEFTTKISNNYHYGGGDHKSSPQRKSKKTTQHKRNKSDTDLEWYFGSGLTQKNVANSKFYTEPVNKDETAINNDPETILINAFFDQNDLFKNECTDERELEKYLTHVVETILYFTLPEEDFACIPLRTFLSTLLANVVFKPLLEMLSDPDFINLQVAKLFAKDPPPVEYFLRALRQSTDLSELRACRQLIIQEMSSKFHESSSSSLSSSTANNATNNATNTGTGNTLITNAELSSLKYAQKLIDLRISYLQNSTKDCLDSLNVGNTIGSNGDKITKLPTLSLDELLFKELARSYFLDYLSVLNLQKYVIFYLTADEWKCLMNQTLLDMQTNKLKGPKDDIMKSLRDKANNIYIEYLTPGSQNYLSIDQGLIEAITLKLNNSNLNPDSTWFDSIMKFVYEKLKNEDIFLPKFYQSSGYKKLLLELEVVGQNPESYIDPLQNYSETGSDTNSGDINFDDDITSSLSISSSTTATGTTTVDGAALMLMKPEMHYPKPDLLDIVGYKHARSHSDCTGIIPSYSDLNLIMTKDLLKIDVEQNYSDSDAEDKQQMLHIENNSIRNSDNNSNNNNAIGPAQERSHSAPSRTSNKTNTSTLLAESIVDSLKTSATTTVLTTTSPSLSLSSKSLTISNAEIPKIFLESSSSSPSLIKPKLKAKIINTAILSEGQYAVYAIQVCIIEDNQEKSWHIYRRYSKFLELKKLLTKRYPAIAKIPFPAKKAFQNTQRSVLEHRMDLLNEFLRHICAWAEDNDDMMKMIRAFLEPDTDDRKIHGGTVIRTIEHIVNPLKTGMRTIRNMPDTLVGGFSRILLGKGPLKEPSFLEVNNLEQSSEYPPLTSAIHLLDEIFDLQARSQWLRRGIINRVLGAPWVSHTANKKIIHAAKSLIELDKIEHILSIVLNSIWPNGKQQKRSTLREDSTKLRTRIAAQMALFALVFDDLKRVVGSETTRSGLLNFFGMWQHKKLNMRIALILMNDILTTLYRVESMTKHCRD